MTAILIPRKGREARVRLAEMGGSHATDHPTDLGMNSHVTRLLRVVSLSAFIVACDAPTAPEEQLTASVLVEPVVLQWNVQPKIVVGVTNISDHDVVIGGPYGCFLAFEVLDRDGGVVLENPQVARLCAAASGEMALAPGATYEETMGWTLQEFRELHWRPVLPDGTYGVRTVLGVMGHGRVALPPVVNVGIEMEEAAQPNRQMKLSNAWGPVH